MTIEQKLMEKAGMILEEKGHAAVELARRSILKEQVEHTTLQDALRYFIEDWNDVLHPALVTLACEAVGGLPEVTEQVGAALVLLAGGADIHDDVIDGSFAKDSVKTVFGKFGKDLAILAGDALLLNGVYMLHDACEDIGETKRKAILEIVKRAFFEISAAEAAETNMRGRIDVPKPEYMEIIRRKVAAGEASSRIGAIIGNGTPEEVEILAEFGHVYGVLISMRDEFVDVFEKDELSNRVEREVLPLPIMLTLADESMRPSLLRLLEGKKTDEKIEKIVDITTNSEQSALLVSEMRQMVDQVLTRTKNLRYCKEKIEFIAKATLEDL